MLSEKIIITKIHLVYTFVATMIDTTALRRNASAWAWVNPYSSFSYSYSYSESPDPDADMGRGVIRSFVRINCDDMTLV